MVVLGLIVFRFSKPPNSNLPRRVVPAGGHQEGPLSVVLANAERVKGIKWAHFSLFPGSNLFSFFVFSK